MRNHNIEVDEKVWNYLKSKAEPFEDTPNSVLNRILFGTVDKYNSTTILKITDNSDLVLPTGIPKALSQVLEVIYEVKKSNRSRTEATNIVARRRDTASQTIIDKYCRQLNKKAYEIDLLLQEQDLSEFKLLLLNKFPKYQDIITSFFNDLKDAEVPKKAEYQENLTEKKQPYEVKKMYALDELEPLNLGKDTKPYQLKIEGQIFQVNNWTDLCIHLVEQLIQKGFLTSSSTPIFNHSSRKQKYFINTEPKHLFREMDGKWKKVDTLFVDTKYNAEAHVKNIASTLRHLDIQDIDFGISLRR